MTTMSVTKQIHQKACWNRDFYPYNKYYCLFTPHHLRMTLIYGHMSTPAERHCSARCVLEIQVDIASVIWTVIQIMNVRGPSSSTIPGWFIRTPDWSWIWSDIETLHRQELPPTREKLENAITGLHCMMSLPCSARVFVTGHMASNCGHMTYHRSLYHGLNFYRRRLPSFGSKLMSQLVRSPKETDPL